MLTRRTFLKLAGAIAALPMFPAFNGKPFKIHVLSEFYVQGYANNERQKPPALHYKPGHVYRTTLCDWEHPWPDEGTIDTDWAEYAVKNGIAEYA